MLMFRSLSIIAIFIACSVNVMADEWYALETHTQGMLGAWSCAAANCHGGERQERVPPQRSGGELEIFRSLDPHARAGAILDSEKFAQILVRLNIATAKKTPDEAHRKTDYQVVDVARLQECMNCHNPAEMENRWSAASEKHHQTATFAIECETCHGPAERWLQPHTRRDWNRSAVGFRDTKNLLVRGRACAHCHVGDENRDMNHDMIAAGHPPLRFELASYMAKLPKHWNDRKARTHTPNLELQLWLVGQVTNFDSSLTLLESRAKRASQAEAKTTPARATAAWPELAEYSCTSCHQALTSSANWSEQKHRHIVREVPLAWNGWNQGFIDLILNDGKSADKQALCGKLDHLRHDMETGAFSDDESLTQLADHVRALRLGSNDSLGFRTYGSQLIREMKTQSSPLIAIPLQDRITKHWNEEQATHAYAYLVAKVQSQYDESAKRNIAPPVSPALLLSLRQMKTNLTPLPGRPFGSAAKVWDEAFTNDVQRAAQLVEGINHP